MKNAEKIGNENETDPSRMEQVDKILNRGVIVDVLPDKESFRRRLLSAEPMKIYIGADPTSTTLHLSHAKNYLLLEEFRKLGHEVHVLFGDFTARIGDPTGKTTARKQLSEEEVKQNVQGWIEQIKPLMDFEDMENPPKIEYNSKWLSKLTMEDVVNLASNVTVQQMIERDMFDKRLKEEKPIYLNEFLYPLMQGYDSVAMDVDAELCGTDQTFNALMGRTLLKKFTGKDKFVVSVNLMENPVTHELMSKSRETGVFLDLDPFNIYGAIMSQPDEMTKLFLVNNTRISLPEIESIMSAKNPRDAKMRAAFEIAKIFHGEEKAREAEENFVKLVQKKESAEDMPEIKMESSNVSLYDLLKTCLPDETSNERRRLLASGAIKIDGVPLKIDELVDPTAKKEQQEKIAITKKLESIIRIPEKGLELKIGKKKWFKVIV